VTDNGQYITNFSDINLSAAVVGTDIGETRPHGSSYVTDSFWRPSA